MLCEPTTRLTLLSKYRADDNIVSFEDMTDNRIRSLSRPPVLEREQTERERTEREQRENREREQRENREREQRENRHRGRSVH
jgi:hypothetical protein